MVFKDIEKEAKDLKHKVEEVESEKDMVSRRDREVVVFKPKDLYSNFKAKEMQYYHSVKVYFGNEGFFRLFLKHFNILEFKEPNCHRIEPLLLFLKLMEMGIIRQEQAGNKIVFKVKGGEYVLESETRFW